MDHGKQRRAMADIRTLATALEEYRSDHPDWRPLNSVGPPSRFAPLLTPKYIRQIPERDGWGHPYRVFVGGETYTIWSQGKDGKRDANWNGATRNFDNDIVYRNGDFIQYGAGG